MYLPTTIHPDNLAETMLGLKRDIRHAQDLSKWFKQNLHLLGIDSPVYDDEARLFYEYSILDLTDSDNYTDPEITGTLSVVVTYKHDRKKHLSQIMGIESIDESKFEKQIKINMRVAEWRFLTSNLVSALLQDHLQVDSLDMSILEHIAEKYVPLHFPAFTWPLLKSMHAADLLPTTSKGRLDSIALDNLLFASTPIPGELNASAILPATLST